MSDKFQNSIKSIISISTIIMFFITIMIIIFKKSKIISVDTDLLYLVLGGLLSKVENVYNYYLGSSQGSADKNKIIQDLKK
jgi:uncharacterized membrane protein